MRKIDHFHDVIETHGMVNVVKLLDLCSLHIQSYVLLKYPYYILFFKFVKKKMETEIKPYGYGSLPEEQPTMAAIVSLSFMISLKQLP